MSNQPQPSSPLRVENSEVAGLNAVQLPLVANRLIRSEAYLLGMAPSSVETSLRINDGDLGIDARVRESPAGSKWLPEGLSVWQFKSGASLTPSDIEKEVNEPGVVNALQAGGTYCLVLSADLTPEAQRIRREALEGFVSKVQPGAACRLMTAAELADWCTETPVILQDFGRPMAGFWRADQWLLQQPRHGIPFQSTDDRSETISQIRQTFSSTDGLIHVHISGEPGVGKTRLALEIFRDHTDLVLYAAEPPGSLEFFSWMAAHPSTRAILIVDECEVGQAERLAQYANMSGRRLRIVTIGHDRPGAGSHIFPVKPLDEDQMVNVVRSAVPSMAFEQARWIAKVAKGYVRLATALAYEVARGALTIADLTATADVQAVLQTLLPEAGNRQVMRGLALLTRVGWDAEVAVEGQALSTFLGVDWNQMREVVAEMTKVGLVARQGRYRYVTPEILALWLAAEEWQSRKDDLLGLASSLPTAESRDSLIERLSGLAGLAEVRPILQEVLGPQGPFDSLDSLDNERVARLFAVVSRGESEAALAALERCFAVETDERLYAFRKGRREIVWTLERLAAWRAFFFRAARLLLRLAEKENESWSNNATGVWTGLFLTHLGGTEVPAQERYVLLEEAISATNSETRKLALSGLRSALSGWETGSVISEEQGGFVPPEVWHPKTLAEDQQCRRDALRILDMALNDSEASIAEEAQSVLVESSRTLVAMGLFDEIVPRLRSIQTDSSERKRRVWEAVRSLLKYEDSYLQDGQRAELESFSNQLYGDSFRDRLQRYAGKHSHVDWPGSDAPQEERAEHKVALLAEEVPGNQDEFRSQLPWLASAAAENVFAFGRRLGELDSARAWLGEILDAVRHGDNDMLLSSYLAGRALSGDDEWREELLDELAAEDSLASLVFNATWRGPASRRGVERVVDLVERDKLEPGRLGFLMYGAWVQGLTDIDVVRLLGVLRRDDTDASVEAGLAMLVQWCESGKSQITPEVEALIWESMESEAAASSGPMIAYNWAKLGDLVIESDPPRIARALMRALADKMMFHDERLKLLNDALEISPKETWAVIAEQLDSDFRLTLNFKSWAEENDFISKLGSASLLEWVNEDFERRSVIVAQLIKPAESITPVIRELLRVGGPDGPAARILRGNFSSGTWSGSMAAREQRQLDVASSWLVDTEPNVRAWAQGIVDGIRADLPQLRIWEEENFF